MAIGKWLGEKSDRTLVLYYLPHQVSIDFHQVALKSTAREAKETVNSF
ncbi:hypothetical protein [Calothrix rhizosoleniae]|nr:hypothetical protein [Calothrix rhizosoleniae]